MVTPVLYVLLLSTSSSVVCVLLLVAASCGVVDGWRWWECPPLSLSFHPSTARGCPCHVLTSHFCFGRCGAVKRVKKEMKYKDEPENVIWEDGRIGIKWKIAFQALADKVAATKSTQ